MTFPSGGGSCFDEDLSYVQKCFKKWSDCERAIAICSLLKQCAHPKLRFIHSKLEATFAQSSDNDKYDEQKANNKCYIAELCDSYKTLTTTTTSDVQLNNNKDYYDSDRILIGDNSTTNLINNISTNNNNNYNNNNVNINNNGSINLNLLADKLSTKDNILNKILDCILMLSIGNDDVIQEYLALLPFMVDDTHRCIINVETVKQALSILIAHPALSTEDLR